MTNASHLTAEDLQTIVVVGCVGLLILSAWLSWRAKGEAELDALLGRGLPDHMVCADDDCDTVLCYCLDQDHSCAGTEEPGCPHPGAFCCGDHRGEECLDCRVDYSEGAWSRW